MNQSINTPAPVASFSVGQSVTRLDGGYTAGRIGHVVALDTVKNRAQVAWFGYPKTWVAFKSIALTPDQHPTETAPALTEDQKRDIRIATDYAPAAEVESAPAPFTVSEVTPEELAAELAPAAEVESAPVLTKKEKRAARRAVRKLAQGVTTREPKTTGPTPLKTKKTIMKKVGPVAKAAKAANLTGSVSMSFANINDDTFTAAMALITEYPLFAQPSNYEFMFDITPNFRLSVILK